ncbi:MAG: hypothetical protein HYY14_05650 [Candidatus Omnitrophica bacterium]|nr:hypothetical protein [Candidatus Omnitrophota bacterium]
MDVSAYERRIAELLPRFLTHLDSNPFSPTFGCMDRDWWHYKIQAFPSATYQQGVLVLAWLYRHGAPGIPAHSPEVLRAIAAALKFWAKIQHRDGSFDEWYPQEHSFVATAFTTHAVSEVWLELGNQITKSTGWSASDTLERAGEWLLRHDDLMLSNHQAGKIAALHNLSLFFPGGRFGTGARLALERLIKVQHPEEGWFPEYGGADPGYQSVTFDYLAQYFNRSRDDNVVLPLEKASYFLSWFLHPDGSVGGTYGSRNARYLFTHGLELVADRIPPAAAILDKMNLLGGEDLPWLPKGMDARYLIFFFLPNLLGAYEVRKERKEPHPREFFLEEATRFFEGAGLWVARRKHYYAVVNVRKGGVLRAHARERTGPGRLAVVDGGYFVRTRGSRVAASHALQVKPSRDFGYEAKELLPGKWKICCRAPFVWVKHFSPSPLRQALFYIFLVTVGRIPWVRHKLDAWLRNALVRRQIRAPYRLERTIVFSAEGVDIEDKITRSRRGARALSLGRANDHTSIHVPSSLQYSAADRWEGWGVEPAAVAEHLNQTGEATLTLHRDFLKSELESVETHETRPQ